MVDADNSQSTAVEAKPVGVDTQPIHTDVITVPAPAPKPARSRRKWFWLAAILGIVFAAVYFSIPFIENMLNTISTDDAYVNGHLTTVAPRVAGQVSRVLVEDNNRVKKGDVLVQLDKVPYQIQVNIKKAAVVSAERDLEMAIAQAKGMVAQTTSNRYKLVHAIQEVNNQIANLAANVATLNSRKATLELARSNLKRGMELLPGGGIGKEDLDQRQQTVKVDEAAVEQALQMVYANRVSLGLPAKPEKGQDLSEVPADLDQNFSTVREALATTLQSAAQLGYSPASWNATPQQAAIDFFKQYDQADLNSIYEQLVRGAPSVRQAEAKVVQAREDLAQAELNLRYCDIVSDIDGVVSSRNVNSGNYVQVGQSLMSVRSLKEVWIDANFKETQLAQLRIGQRVVCETDMYGSKRTYEGRITGFTMGTGQSLALLPAQNATGNYVKIVQRLPVRIELTNYDPEKGPLFIGLSVNPSVYFKEAPQGPHAGEFLQPALSLPREAPEPKP